MRLKFSLPFATAFMLCFAWAIGLSAFALSLSEQRGLVKVNDVEVRHFPQENIRFEDFAIRRMDGSFVFAADAPFELRTSFEFSEDSDLLVSVQGSYPQPSCRRGGVGKASFSMKGRTSSTTIALPAGIPQKISFSTTPNEFVPISFKNSHTKGCGTVVVSFEKPDHTTRWVLGFLAFWLSVLWLCRNIDRLPILVLGGSFFHFLLLFGELTFEPLNFVSFAHSLGLTLVVSALAGFSLTVKFAKRFLAGITVLLSTVLVCIFSAFILHQIVFETPFNAEAVHAILQSYLGQAVEFLMKNSGLESWFLFLMLPIAMIKMYKLLIKANRKSKFTEALPVFLLATGSILLFGTTGKVASVSLVRKAVAQYTYEIERYQEVSQARRKEPVIASLATNFEANKTILVVGESVNKAHMSAYGYPRPTTPRLDSLIGEGEAIKFNRVFSNHTHSNPTISLMMTAANQQVASDWMDSPSVLSVAAGADLETLWLSNHRMLGGWSNHITAIAKEASLTRTINLGVGNGNGSPGFDHELLSLFDDLHPDTGLSVLHLYNSHVDYCKRYPEERSRFKKSLEPAIFGTQAASKPGFSRGLNCYDNTVNYTDQVLSELIQRVRGMDAPTVILYIADHAEDVVGAKAHNSAQFDYTMVNIPLFVWANEPWRQQHGKLWKNLSANKNAIFTNDFLFETLMGLMGISSDYSNPEKDLSSSLYSEPETPKTLHGKRVINDPEHWQYWQRENANTLSERRLRWMVAEVASVAQLYAAAELGARDFHLGASFSDLKSDQRLVFLSHYLKLLGSDRGDMTLWVDDELNFPQLIIQLEPETMTPSEKAALKQLKIRSKPSSMSSMNPSNLWEPDMIQTLKLPGIEDQTHPIPVRLRTEFGL